MKKLKNLNIIKKYYTFKKKKEKLTQLVTKSQNSTLIAFQHSIQLKKISLKNLNT